MTSPATPSLPRAPRPSRHPSGVGVDLNLWHADVRKIVLRVLGRRIRRAGLEPHDVMSEVYRRILVANEGASAYDPARASFGRYCVLQGVSAIRNMMESRDSRERHEQVGMLDADGMLTDAASVEVEDHDDDLERAAMELARSAAEAKAILLLAQGADDWTVRSETGCCPVGLRARLASRIPRPQCEQHTPQLALAFAAVGDAVCGPQEAAVGAGPTARRGVRGRAQGASGGEGRRTRERA